MRLAARSRNKGGGKSKRHQQQQQQQQPTTTKNYYTHRYPPNTLSSADRGKKGRRCGKLAVNLTEHLNNSISFRITILKFKSSRKVPARSKIQWRAFERRHKTFKYADEAMDSQFDRLHCDESIIYFFGSNEDINIQHSYIHTYKTSDEYLTYMLFWIVW